MVAEVFKAFDAGGVVGGGGGAEEVEALLAGFFFEAGAQQYLQAVSSPLGLYDADLEIGGTESGVFLVGQQCREVLAVAGLRDEEDSEARQGVVLPGTDANMGRPQAGLPHLLTVAAQEVGTFQTRQGLLLNREEELQVLWPAGPYLEGGCHSLQGTIKLWGVIKGSKSSMGVKKEVIL